MARGDPSSPCAGVLLAATASLSAAELPAGTRLSVRLNQNVYSHAVATASRSTRS